MRRRPGFRHGMRVRIDGARGVLWGCLSRFPGGATNWRVRLLTGKWVEPVGIIVDRIVDDPPGELAPDDCASCRLPFYRGVGSDDLLCDRCNAEQFGAATREPDPPKPDTRDAVSHPRRHYGGRLR